MAKRDEQEYSSQAPAPYIGQLLSGGIFPYASQFLTQQFQNYGTENSSPYTYTGQRVADFDPRERYGMQMADQAIGSYRPYLGQQSNLLNQAAQKTRDSFKRFDPNSAKRYYNPYEDRVVDQTMKDVREGLAMGDMAMRDDAVSGGAFGGARSRLRRSELAADTARGAAEQIGAIRSQGYQDAQNRSQQAFESQQQRQLAGANALAGYGGQYGGMASLLPQLQQQDVASMMGMGGMGRGRQQSLMDLNYQNYVGQYNLPMQTLQNVGALTASLGPMAGGYGYAGAEMPTQAGVYTPNNYMQSSPTATRYGVPYNSPNPDMYGTPPATNQANYTGMGGTGATAPGPDSQTGGGASATGGGLPGIYGGFSGNFGSYF